MRNCRAPSSAGCSQNRIQLHSKLRNAPSTTRTVRATANATATVTSLVSTLTSKGAAFPKAELSASVADDSQLLTATDDVNSGETLLSVPEDLWLTAEGAQRSPIGSLITGLEPWLQIALWILSEGFNPSSSIHAYVSSLPTSINSPLFWTPDELEPLQGTQLLESTTGYMQFFQSRYQQLQDELFSSNSTAFPADQFSFDRFLWAVATVRSRTHPPLEGEDMALVPGADLVVHRKGSSNRLKVVKGGFLGRTRMAVLEAGRPLRKGEALSLDFGADEKLDSLVLLDHGVLDPVSAPGGYQLAVAIPQEDRNLYDKLDILEAQGLQQAASFLLRSDQPPSDDMLAFLRLMQLCNQDAFLLESIFRAEAWGHMQLPVSDFNENLVCEAMILGAREALRGYPTSIEDDLTLLRNGSVPRGSRFEAAVLVRLGEKEALDSSLRWFEGRQAERRTLEYYADRRLKRLGLMDERGRTTWDGFFKDNIA